MTKQTIRNALHAHYRDTEMIRVSFYFACVSCCNFVAKNKLMEGIVEKAVWSPRYLYVTSLRLQATRGCMWIWHLMHHFSHFIVRLLLQEKANAKLSS